MNAMNEVFWMEYDYRSEGCSGEMRYNMSITPLHQFR